MEEALTPQRRAWRTADPEEVAKAAKEINLGILELRTREAIDGYVESIIAGIHEVAEKVVPMAKSGERAHTF